MYKKTKKGYDLDYFDYMKGEEEILEEVKEREPFTALASIKSNLDYQGEDPQKLEESYNRFVNSQLALNEMILLADPLRYYFIPETASFKLELECIFCLNTDAPVVCTIIPCYEDGFDFGLGTIIWDINKDMSTKLLEYEESELCLAEEALVGLRSVLVLAQKLHFSEDEVAITTIGFCLIPAMIEESYIHGVFQIPLIHGEPNQSHLEVIQSLDPWAFMKEMYSKLEPNQLQPFSGSFVVKAFPQQLEDTYLMKNDFDFLNRMFIPDNYPPGSIFTEENYSRLKNEPWAKQFRDIIPETYSYQEVADVIGKFNDKLLQGIEPEPSAPEEERSNKSQGERSKNTRKSQRSNKTDQDDQPAPEGSQPRDKAQ